MRRFDRTIREGSRIAKLPPFLQPMALWARNVIANESYHHQFDGMATRNNDGFRSNPRFRKAYERAVLAAGWDYAIPYRVHQALWCSRQAQKIDGDFVELGTGRGFMMSAVLADFADWNSSGRSLHLFDTFMSAPPDATGKQSSTDAVSPYYAKSVDDVKRNFSEWSEVRIYRGNVFETLPSLAARAVAFLHIDMNFYEPEIYGLRTLWDRIPRGGIVLLDDYANNSREQQYRAMNELADELKFDILSTPSGQGIIVK